MEHHSFLPPGKEYTSLTLSSCITNAGYFLHRNHIGLSMRARWKENIWGEDWCNPDVEWPEQIAERMLLYAADRMMSPKRGAGPGPSVIWDNHGQTGWDDGIAVFCQPGENDKPGENDMVTGHQAQTASPYAHTQLAALIHAYLHPEAFCRPGQPFRSSDRHMLQTAETARVAAKLYGFIRSKSGIPAYRCLWERIQETERLYAIRDSRCFPARHEVRDSAKAHVKIQYFGGPFKSESRLQELLHSWEEDQPLECGNIDNTQCGSQSWMEIEERATFPQREDICFQYEGMALPEPTNTTGTSWSVKSDLESEDDL